MLSERAPAKINLTLSVLGRRADGYHELDSLVVFARDLHDDLSFTPGGALSLDVDGPAAQEAGEISDNLVLKAARALIERRKGVANGAFRLTKRIPVAAGLGGGSADAAAALRLLARASDLPLDDLALRDAARATGADVPVCLDPRARVMRGVGDVLSAPLDSPALHLLLVNPGVACPTGPVFAALGLANGEMRKQAREAPPSSRDALHDWIAAGVNDLEPPAIGLVPAISGALALLRAQPSCRLARMSGSGATCFGLFDAQKGLASAAATIAHARPAWRVAPTLTM